MESHVHGFIQHSILCLKTTAAGHVTSQSLTCCKWSSPQPYLNFRLRSQGLCGYALDIQRNEQKQFRKLIVMFSIKPVLYDTEGWGGSQKIEFTEITVSTRTQKTRHAPSSKSSTIARNHSFTRLRKVKYSKTAKWVHLSWHCCRTPATREEDMTWIAVWATSNFLGTCSCLSIIAASSGKHPL